MIDQSMYASAVDSVEKLKLDEGPESRQSPQVQSTINLRIITINIWGVHINIAEGG